MRVLPPEMLAALEATGLPWALEQGSRHRKLRVAGRFIAILPSGKCHANDRATRNVIAHIRRAARNHTGESHAESAQ